MQSAGILQLAKSTGRLGSVPISDAVLNQQRASVGMGGPAGRDSDPAKIPKDRLRVPARWSSFAWPRTAARKTDGAGNELASARVVAVERQAEHSMPAPLDY